MGGSGVQRPLKLGKYLARRGVDVTFLVPSDNQYHISDPSLLEEVEDQERIHFLRVEGKTPADSPFLKGLHRSYRQRLSPILTRLTSWWYLPDNKKGWILPALQAAMKAHKRHPFDLIFSTAAPYSNLLLAAEIKKQCHLPVWMDLRDDWLNSHLLRYPTKWHYKRMAEIERDTLQSADVISVINTGVKVSLMSRLTDIPEPKVLPNGFDPEDFPKEFNPAANLTNTAISTEVHSIQDQPSNHTLNLLYSGLFYGRQQPDIFLKGAKLAIEQRPELATQLKLHFQGDFFERHLQLGSKLGLQKNLIIHGNLPHKESVFGLMKADILWLIVPKQPHSESHTPGKLYEYMGTLKPVLALSELGLTTDLLNQYGASFRCEPDNPHSIAETILDIHTKWEAGELPFGNRDFIQQFDRSVHATQIASALDELLKGFRNS